MTSRTAVINIATLGFCVGAVHLIIGCSGLDSGADREAQKKDKAICTFTPSPPQPGGVHGVDIVSKKLAPKGKTKQYDVYYLNPDDPKNPQLIGEALDPVESTMASKKGKEEKAGSLHVESFTLGSGDAGEIGVVEHKEKKGKAGKKLKFKAQCSFVVGGPGPVSDMGPVSDTGPVSDMGPVSDTGVTHDAGSSDAGVLFEP